MARQTTISVKMSRFGLGLVRTAIKVSAVLAVNASLATVTFGQDASSAAPVAPAPPSWIDQVQAFRQNLTRDAKVCGKINLEPTPGKSAAGYQICAGTDGISHGGNIRNVTLGNDGPPGTLSPDGNKATVGYSFGVVTPDGGLTGGIEYNPATRAVRVSGGPAWGFDAPGSPFKAEISGELGLTYIPPATQRDGSLTSAQADWWQAQAALQAAREQQRLQAMTYQQKLAELSNMINQGAQPAQLLDYVRQQNLSTSGQYPASAPSAAQILTQAQMASQMNGGVPSQAMMQPRPGSSLPPIGAGAYNPPIPIASQPNSAANQAYATRYSYDPNAQKTAVSGPLSQSSQTPMGSGNGSSYPQTSPPPVTPNIPAMSQRAFGTQSQTAALHFPGE